MRVVCTGQVTANGTKILVGTFTKFLTELRPYDQIQVGTNTVYVQAIVNDNTLIAASNIASAINTKLYITIANPFFLLPTAVPAYQYANTNISSKRSHNNQLYGGQVNNHNYDWNLSTLDSSKSLTLPYGYSYYTPYKDLTYVNTTADSTVLTAATLSTVISTTANSDKVSFVSGSPLLLRVGARVVIEGVKYTISRIDLGEQVYNVYWTNQSIYLDKPVPKTYGTVYMTLDTDLAAIFPQGSKVLLNGKLYSIVRASGSYLQVKYPLSASATVSLRRPLMATQTGANVIEFFNTDFSTAYLKPGNVVIVQDFRSEDELYSVNSAYTEIKHIVRAMEDGTVLTAEKHRYNFSGIACFGVPNDGFYTHPIKVKAQSGSNGVAIEMYDYNYNVCSAGSYLILDDLVCTIKTISSSRALFINEAIPYADYTLRVPVSLTPPSYTPQIINLCLKLASDIIQTGIKQTATLEGLMSRYLFKQQFAYNAFTARPAIYNVYSPELFATNRLCVPPHEIIVSTAVYKSTPYGTLDQDMATLEHCGVPLTSVKD